MATAAALTLFDAGVASAAAPSLGAAEPFLVLAFSGVVNTGPSARVFGDLGVSPGTQISGFPPGLVVGGGLHQADAAATQAQSDVTSAYNDAAGRAPATTVASDLGGQTLGPGVHRTADAMSLTGTVTLDARGDVNGVFIFQSSALTTAPGSNVLLIGVNPCNVFWQVGGSATLGAGSSFSGTIMADQSITTNTAARVVGRLLALHGAVALDTPTITPPVCPITGPGAPGQEQNGPQT